MSKILIISATKGNNLVLAKKIGNYVSIDNKIISFKYNQSKFEQEILKELKSKLEEEYSTKNFIFSLCSC